MDRIINNTQTTGIRKKVLQCESVEDLKIIINRYSDYYVEWKKYIHSLMIKRGLSYRKMSQMTGFSTNTIQSWMKQNIVPRSREHILKLEMGLRSDLLHTNFVLQRYGKYSCLYSKSLEDAIAIYVISHYPSEEVNAYEYYCTLKEKYRMLLNQKKQRSFADGFEKKTEGMEEYIVELPGEKEFEQFVHKHLPEFMNSYYQLQEFLEVYIQQKSENRHSFMIENELNIQYDKMLSGLKNWGIVPERNKLIRLGIRLGMSSFEIEMMLSLAKMEKLCAKEKVEMIVMFVLENYYLENPEEQIKNMQLVGYFSNNQKIREAYEYQVNELLGTKNVEELRWDLEEYLRDTLQQLEMEQEFEA